MWDFPTRNKTERGHPAIRSGPPKPGLAPRCPAPHLAEERPNTRRENAIPGAASAVSSASSVNPAPESAGTATGWGLGAGGRGQGGEGGGCAYRDAGRVVGLHAAQVILVGQQAVDGDGAACAAHGYIAVAGRGFDADGRVAVVRGAGRGGCRKPCHFTNMRTYCA